MYITSIRINKNTIRSHLLKLKKNGIEKLKVLYEYYMNECINEKMEMEIDKILEHLRKDTTTDLVINDNGIKGIRIMYFPIWAYCIIDENLSSFVDFLIIKKLC